MFQHLPGGRRIARLQGVAQADLEPVDLEQAGQFVHHCLVRDGALRHAEAAERARRMAMGEETATARAHVRHGIGPRRMDRHPGRHGRAPARVGTGVEVRVDLAGKKASLRVAPELCVYA